MTDTKPDRPAGLWVVAILAIVLGGLGTCGGLFGLFSAAIQDGVAEMQENLQRNNPNPNPEMRRMNEEIQRTSLEIQRTWRIPTVIAQVVNTAAITAPSDLWLLRLVLSTFDGLGLSQRLLDGERLNPRELRDAAGRPLLAEELKADLELLRSRRLIFRESDGYGLSGDPSARRALGPVSRPQAAARAPGS